MAAGFGGSVATYLSGAEGAVHSLPVELGVAVGEHVVVWGWISGGGGTPDGGWVTDSKGNTWQLDDDVQLGAAFGQRLVRWSCRVTTALVVDVDVISIAQDFATQYRRASAWRLTGLASSGWHASTIKDSDAHFGDPAPRAGPTGVPSQADSIAVFGVAASAVASGDWNPLVGWTETDVIGASNRWLATQYKVLAAAAAQSPSGDFDDDPCNWAAAVGIYYGAVTGGAPTITTMTLPDAEQGTFYSQSLAVSGGTPPYTWSVISGSLPVGLALNGSTGLISGTPTGTGAASFTVQVSGGGTDTQALTFDVNAPPVVVPGASEGTFVPKMRFRAEVSWDRAVGLSGIFVIGVSDIGEGDVIAASRFSESFSGAEDDITRDLFGAAVQRGRAGLTGPMGAGTSTLQLKDSYVAAGEERQGKYNPQNPDSPLAGFLRPRRPFRLVMIDPFLSTEYPLFYGFLRTSSYAPGPRRGAATLGVIDLFTMLSSHFCMLAPTGPTTTGAVIGMLLDEVGWTDPLMRSLDVGDDVPDFAAEGDKTALQHVDDLLEVERGRFYVDGSGRAIFESRYAWHSKVSIGSVDASLVSALPGFDEDSVRNRAVVAAGDAGDPQIFGDEASIQEFGMKDWDEIRSPYIGSDGQALSLAQYLVAQGKEPTTPLYGVTLDGRTWDQLRLQGSVEIGSRITVGSAGTVVAGQGLDGDYAIENVAHELSELGRLRTTLVLSRPLEFQPFLIGSSTIGGGDALVY